MFDCSTPEISASWTCVSPRSTRARRTALPYTSYIVGDI